MTDGAIQGGLKGLIRVLFFLAVAGLGITVVVVGVTTLYDPPDSGFSSEFDDFGFGFEGDSFGQSDEQADYNRNVGLIFGFLGTAVFAAGLLALDSRYNALRCGLLAGGVGLVFYGVGVGSDGSDDWLTFLTSGIALAVLFACTPWVDDGLPADWFRRASSGGGTSGGTPPPPAPPSEPPTPPMMPPAPPTPPSEPPGLA